MSTLVKKAKRRSTNLTIREDILAEAKILNLNISKEAETGIEAAVKKAREEAWLEQNRAALDAHNARVAVKGTLLKPLWARD